jgi:chromosome segregation ATPase
MDLHLFDSSLRTRHGFEPSFDFSRFSYFDSHDPPSENGSTFKSKRSPSAPARPLASPINPLWNADESTIDAVSSRQTKSTGRYKTPGEESETSEDGLLKGPKQKIETDFDSQSVSNFSSATSQDPSTINDSFSKQKRSPSTSTPPLASPTDPPCNADESTIQAVSSRQRRSTGRYKMPGEESETSEDGLHKRPKEKIETGLDPDRANPRTKIATQEKQIAELEKKNRELLDNVAELNQTRQTELEVKADEIEKLKTANLDLTERLAKAQTAITEQKKAIRKLNTQNGNAQAKADQYEIQNTDLQTHLRKSQAQSETLIQRISDFQEKEQKLIQLEKENKELNDEFSLTREVVALQQAEITKLKEKNQELLDNVMVLNQKDDEIGKLKTANQNLTKKLRNLKAQANRFVAKIRQDTETQIDQYKMQIAQLERDKGELVAARERQMTNGADNSQRVMQLELEYNQSLKEQAQMAQTVKTMDDTIAELKSQNEALILELNQPQEAGTTREEKTSELEKENSKLLTELKQVQMENRVLEKAQADSRQRCGETQNKLQNAIRNEANAKSELEKVRKMLLSQMQLIRDANEQRFLRIKELHTLEIRALVSAYEKGNHSKSQSPLDAPP